MWKRQPGLMLIRADADSQIGAGHVMRTLALAQAWQHAGGEVTYLSRCESADLQQRLHQSGVEWTSLAATHPDPRDVEQTLAILERLGAKAEEKANWLVLDGYHFTPEYYRTMRGVTSRTLVLDDLANLSYYDAGMVLNQNIHAERKSYPVGAATVLLCGTGYALLRPEFQAWREWRRAIPESARRVLVTLGGADPDNVTLKVLQGLGLLGEPELQVRAIVGPANPHRDALEAYVAGTGGTVELLYSVLDMPGQMAWADLAVSAGGSTCWELALMALPTVLIVVADNQNDIVAGLQEEGAAHNLGWHAEVTPETVAAKLSRLLHDSDARSDLAARGRELVDGRGAERLVAQLLSYSC